MNRRPADDRGWENLTPRRRARIGETDGTGTEASLRGQVRSSGKTGGRWRSRPPHQMGRSAISRANKFPVVSQFEERTRPAYSFRRPRRKVWRALFHRRRCGRRGHQPRHARHVRFPNGDTTKFPGKIWKRGVSQWRCSKSNAYSGKPADDPESHAPTIWIPSPLLTNS